MKKFKKKTGSYPGAGKPAGKGSYNKFAKKEFKRSDERTQLFQATCSECGNSCEVPFKPNGKKPVFCRNCFKKSEHAEFTPGKFGKSNYKPNSYKSFAEQAPKESSYKRELDQINIKLDKILKALNNEAEY